MTGPGFGTEMQALDLAGIGAVAVTAVVLAAVSTWSGPAGV